MLKFLLLAFLALIVLGIVFLRNLINSNKNSSFLRKLIQNKISVDSIISECDFIYAKKIIPGSLGGDFLFNTFSRMTDINFKSDNQSIKFCKRLNNDNVLLIVSSLMKDFMPLDNELIERNINYTKHEYFKFLLKIEGEELSVYSTEYNDLTMKIEKEKIAHEILGFIL